MRNQPIVAPASVRGKVKQRREDCRDYLVELLQCALLLARQQRFSQTDYLICLALASQANAAQTGGKSRRDPVRMN